MSRDLLLAAAGAGGALPAAQYIEDVFSTTLFTGTGAAQTVDTKVALTGGNALGGLVMTKSRSAVGNFLWTDTVRGASNYLNSSASTAGQVNDPSQLNSFSGSTFQVGSGFTNGATYAAWTFARAGKFMDIVTWTGDGSASHSIPHGLGCVPGMIIVKRTDAVGSWAVYHCDGYIVTGGGTLTMTNAAATSPVEFRLSSIDAHQFTVTATSYVNAAGGSFVAYVFAGADGDSTPGSNDLVKCGYYTGNGNAAGPLVQLGWEPQFVLIKAISATGDWYIFDRIRGLCFEASSAYLFADTTAAEANGAYIRPNSNGFQPITTITGLNANGTTYAYMAIRNGNMRVPTDATKVFMPVARKGTSATASIAPGFSPDLVMIKGRNVSYGACWFDRGRGANYSLTSSGTAGNTSLSSTVNSFAQNDGVTLSTSAYVNNSSYNYIDYYFKRARGFFDIVYWMGDGVDQSNAPNGSVPHALGTYPNLFIWKNLTAASNWWMQGFTGIGDVLFGQTTAAQNGNPTTGFMSWSDKAMGPGSSGTAYVDTNVANDLYVGYLFANCPGVCSIGTYTGNGAGTQYIPCGFSNGPRFIMIKRIDNTGNWNIGDSARGITSSTDPEFYWNTAGIEPTATDWLSPDNNGFYVMLESTANVNINGAQYWYMAIA